MSTAIQKENDRLKQSARSARLRESSMGQRAIGKIAAAGGGVFGAVVHRYLPAIVPGATLDHPAVWAVGLALDGWAISSRSQTVNSIAEGFTGYLTGNEVYKLLP